MEALFDKLGLNKENGLYLLKEELWKSDLALPSRVRRLIELRLKPDAFFCFDSKPLIFFFHHPINKAELHKAIWNFNECPVAIIIENDSVEIFNGFRYEKTIGSLEKLGGNEKIDEFSYFQLVTGKTWETYNQELNFKNRVDYKLLENIKTARKLLVEKGDLGHKTANALLGKSIFVRYLIDRKVTLNFEGHSRLWTNSDFCGLCADSERLKAFFSYLENKDTGFNGDLFPIEEKEFKKIGATHLAVIANLLSGHQLEKRQASLFDLYDFSVIPIEFISNVYEMFIGQENQRTTGSFYTPLFLVDYILNETVQKRLHQIPYGSYRRDFRASGILDSALNLSICKVLDPACGSGIFLVETLRKIIERYIDETEIDTSSNDFKEVIKEIAKTNLYGIDKDESAIQVAIFSIYLTLLDYLEPPAIENFKFPYLLNSNFFTADFFDEEHEYNTKLKKIGFDFILGNPPWKGSGLKENGQKYLDCRKSKEKELSKKYEIAVNNKEIVEGFILRVSDFCSSQTAISFVVRSLILYNLGSKDEFSPFRSYWLQEFYVDRVFELAPVRQKIFEKSNTSAVAPAAVLFYRYAHGEQTDGHLVEHIALKESRFFSLFKIFTITRSDYKKVSQRKFKEFDWLWKVLVYGNYLDFNFIQRLKNRKAYPTIKEVISDDEKFVVGTGLQYSKKEDYPSEHLKGFHFIDTYSVTDFFIDQDKVNLFEKLKVHRLRDERIFSGSKLLIRKGLNTKSLLPTLAISKNKLLFKDSITSIKAVNTKDLYVLIDISFMLKSDLFSYFAINTFGSIGIEREQVQNTNKFSLPYLKLELQGSYSKLEFLYARKKEVKNNIQNTFQLNEIESAINFELSKVNEAIFKRLNVNSAEESLIEYALTVNRTLITGTEQEKKVLFSAISFKNQLLDVYASIYLNRFKNKFLSANKKFVIDIWHTPQIIGMFFRLVDVEEERKEIEWVNKSEANNAENEMLRFIVSLSSEKITERLFVQKDVRGFEKDYFYIFKPNEKRLWHKAIGYLDVDNFADVILKEGRGQIDV